MDNRIETLACGHWRSLHKTQHPMKLQRLWQPTSPVFWMMVAFNVLSSVGAWVLRAVALPYPVMLFVALVALGNVAGGLWCAWRLLQGESPKK